MRSQSPSRFLRALAVTLPLGIEPTGDGAAPPRVELPAEVVADDAALGAVGVVFHGGARSEICAAVALRDRAMAPQLAALQWRTTAGPGRASLLPVEKLPPVETPEGFVVWYACTRVPAPGPGAALSAILVEPTHASSPARRRLDLPGDSREVWRWRLVEPVEARADLAAAPQRPRHEARSRGVAVYAAKTPD